MLDLLAPPSSVPGLEFRMLAAVAFTAAAAYFDVFNKKWVPNWLLYGFVASAILLNVVFFEQNLFLQALAFGIAAVIVSYPLYRAGQLGGADVYAYAAIAACIPFLPKPLLAGAQSIPYPFILSVLAPTGIAFILHMLVRFIPYISRQIAKGKVSFTAEKLAAPAIVSFAFCFFIYSLSSLPVSLPGQYLAIVSFLFVALVFFSLFKNDIKDSMVEAVPISSIQEEDVLAIEKMDASLVKKLGLSALVSAKMLSTLRKAKLKKAPVYTRMPFFLPYLLFGLLFTIIFGDLIFYIVKGVALSQF